MGLYSVLDSKNIQKRFISALEAGSESLWAQQIAFMNDSSDRATEEYNWLGQVPQMQRWIGNRGEKFFNKYALTISNFTYETTIPVDVNDSRRDKTGFINRRVGELAVRANTHWNSLAATLLNNGGGSTSGLAYDGQYFFDTDHNESGTNQTNDWTATEIPAADVAVTSAPTVTEAANILNQTIEQLQSLTDDQSEPINQEINSVLVLCSKPSISAAFKVARNPTITLLSQSSNPLLAQESQIDVRYSSRLTAANSIEVFINDGSDYKPLIFQDEQGVEFQILTDGSDETFKFDRYLFGLRAVRGASYGGWQRAARVTFS